jgi:hypothetical protein
MEFEIIHLSYEKPPVKFTEETAPGWMKSEAYFWWWEKHILTLSIGQSVETDFRRITRIA